MINDMFFLNVTLVLCTAVNQLFKCISSGDEELFLFAESLKKYFCLPSLLDVQSLFDYILDVYSFD